MMHSSSNFSPGDHVHWFAKRMKWKIAQNNIMVEGESDYKYFRLAADLFRNKNGEELICDKLSIFPVGIDSEGGTYGIQNHFPAFRQFINLDVDKNGRSLFRCIALLDSDPPGKFACNALTGKHTKFQKFRDVFLLHRLMPKKTGDPSQLEKSFNNLNSVCNGLDCVIEDLINSSLIDMFVEHNGNCFKKETQEKNGFRHYSFHSHYKASLYRFVKENAFLEDVEKFVDILKFFRLFFGLEAQKA